MNRVATCAGRWCRVARARGEVDCSGSDALVARQAAGLEGLLAAQRDVYNAALEERIGVATRQTLAEMVEAQLLTCRLEVNADFAGPIESRGNGRFWAVPGPALDQTSRRQFPGASRIS